MNDAALARDVRREGIPHLLVEPTVPVVLRGGVIPRREIPAPWVSRVDRAADSVVAGLARLVRDAHELLTAAVLEALLLDIGCPAAVEAAEEELEETVVVGGDVGLHVDVVALFIDSDGVTRDVLSGRCDVVAATLWITADGVVCAEEKVGVSGLVWRPFVVWCVPTDGAGAATVQAMGAVVCRGRGVYLREVEVIPRQQTALARPGYQAVGEGVGEEGEEEDEG